MGAVSSIAALIKMGFPEEVAKRIASGELPMDTASRMERAAEQGYDVDSVLYHQTGQDFDEFIPGGPNAQDNQQAVFFRLLKNDPAMNAHNLDSGPQRTMSVVSKPMNYLHTNFPADKNEDFSSLFPSIINKDDATKLKSRGHNSVYNESDIDGIPSEVALLNPDEIRSTNAAFDPDYKGSNILGEYALPAGSTALMASLLAAPEEAEAGPLAKVISKTINRQDDADLPWSSEAQYTHDQSGGFMRLGIYPDGRVSTLELEVPEEFRRRGIGGELQELALRDYPEMQGQVSSKSALRNAYRLGRRPVEEPDATLERALEMQSQASSVNMKRPTNAERGAATPGMMALLGAGGAGATAAAKSSHPVSQQAGQLWDDLKGTAQGLLDVAEMPARGLQGLGRVGYGMLTGEGFDEAMKQGNDVLQGGIEAAAKRAGDEVFRRTGSAEMATAAYTAVMTASPI